MSDWRLAYEQALLTLERETKQSIRVDAAALLCDLAFDAPREVLSEFAPAVVRLVADGNHAVRCAGLALGTEVLPNEEAKALLLRHVGDATARVRIEAVGRLADLGRADTRGVFAVALTDAVPSVRFEAARGMVALRHSAGLEVLLAALDDGELRFRAAAALAQLGDRAAVPKLKQVFRGWFVPAFDRTQLAGALAQLGDSDGIEHLFKRAGKRWSLDRAMAIELLGEVKAPGASARLLEILKDPNDSCRGAAARGLGRLGDASVEAGLCEALDHGQLSEDDRLDVAEGLLRLGTQTARGRVAALQFESPEARAELIEMLAP